MSAPSAWISESTDFAREPRLLCFPHAGGGSAYYFQWRRDLAQAVEVIPVRLPGREARLNDPPYESMLPLVDDLSAGLAEIATGDYAIFGHSMGALIGYELACRWQRQLRPPRCLIISSCRAPDQFPIHEEPMHLLPTEEMIERLIEYYGTGQGTVAEERALMQLMAHTIRADLKLVEEYQPISQSTLECPVIALGGADDSRVSRTMLQAWRRMSQGQFAMRVFPAVISICAINRNS